MASAAVIASAEPPRPRSSDRPPKIGHCRSQTQVLDRPKTAEEDYERLGLSEQEVKEACHQFKQRLAFAWKDVQNARQRRNTLRIQDMDLVLRQLRLFKSTRFIWALFLEVDENDDGTVDQEEFLMMVAKLRGRRPLSSKFYLGTLPRKATEQYSHVFQIMDRVGDGFLDEEAMILGIKQLNPTVSIDQDKFRGMMLALGNGDKQKYDVNDFLLVQAKCRRQPPAFEAAFLSFTQEEREQCERTFLEWRTTRNTPAAVSNPAELRNLMSELGHEVRVEQVNHLMEELELEKNQVLQPAHFLFLCASVGAGTAMRQRPMIWPGAAYQDAFSLGFPVDELWDLGFDDLPSIKKAGYSAQELYRHELASVAQLRQLGFQAGELRKSGIAARDLHAAGFSLAALRNGGFSAEVLSHCVRVVATEN